MYVVLATCGLAGANRAATLISPIDKALGP